ncbi:glycogen debranching N-terminal domain-containing protein [Kribbella sp. DT2]|uniref:amylo-alpha-1,6-glucosidase n=1 Tax=Kribbella sp. DT2 TaxID=3393427 RepID=UPI003CEA8D30
MAARTSKALHELVTTLAAPWVVLSPRSGQLSGSGAEGVFARDRRILSRLVVTVDGREPLPVHVDEPGQGVTVFGAVIEGLGDGGHDPTVRLRRTRTVGGDGLTERITVVNNSHQTVDCLLTVALGTDLAGTAEVRSEAAADLPTVSAAVDGDALRWEKAGTRVSVAAAESVLTPDGVQWDLQLKPGDESTVTLQVTAEFPAATGFEIKPPEQRPAYDEVVLSCSDSRVERWVRRSLDDLAALQLGTGGERYLGAGPPWYLTLFGRDSLISAGMLIPVDPELAAGTLRALAAWQGSKVDADAAEQPGKIPHELRAEVADHGNGLVLPVAYYGTHDATQLWITTLHKAWRWGMPADEIRALLPNLQRALRWMRDYADPDGDGFLEYVDESGHGLANQGWKDSSDSVQWPDGTIATAPIALCEVQGYAYAAALAGAELLDAFAGDLGDARERDGAGASGGADEWRVWAAELKTRFREKFWVDGYPAIALDGAKRPVAGPASNMGHLLGTGLLDADEEATVADLLGDQQLDSGFGLRTLTTEMPGFNPLGYHTGSVWPHDTAMTVQGLYAAGRSSVATTYTRGLLEAAESFGYRLPELYGGAGTAEEGSPTPYPLSCRPQAWAAASAVAVIVAALGIEPDVPAGTLDITPASDFPWRSLRVDGVRVGERTLTVEYTDGSLTLS